MNMELKAAMTQDLFNQVAHGLSEWTCAALRTGKTIGDLAEAAEMSTDRWWKIIEREVQPSLHELACMAFALGAQVRIALPEPGDVIPF